MNDDDVVASYNGVRILVQPTQLADGGWKANFTLLRLRGSETDAIPYYGERAYPTRQIAKQESLNAARLEIDKSD
jgi:hypothetical protein